MGRFKNFRFRIYEIIEKDNGHNILSKIYDIYILILVFLSAVPLVFKIWTVFIYRLDRVVTSLFIIDYILRWMTADFQPKLKKYPRWKAFLLYPSTPMAIIDLLGIFPAVMSLPFFPDLKLNAFIKVLRMMRVFRCMRFFKTMRYSDSFIHIYHAVRSQKRLLLTVLWISILYIFVSAAVIFSAEPDTFHNFFEALYWSTVTLTTVGYGDIHPVTNFGRAVSMVSTVFGTAVVAMPAGIIISGFMEEIDVEHAEKERLHEQEISTLLEEIRQLEDKLEQIAQQDLKNISSHDTINKK